MNRGKGVTWRQVRREQKEGGEGTSKTGRERVGPGEREVKIWRVVVCKGAISGSSGRRL
jgi:hypothetical protein